MFDDIYCCPVCEFEATCDDCAERYATDADFAEDVDFVADARFNGYDGSCECGEPDCPDCFPDCDD